MSILNAHYESSHTESKDEEEEGFYSLFSRCILREIPHTNEHKSRLEHRLEWLFSEQTEKDMDPAHFLSILNSLCDRLKESEAHLTANIGIFEAHESIYDTVMWLGIENYTDMVPNSYLDNLFN